MSNSQLSIMNSQLKKGYKLTEVGLIPEDWEVLTLSALIDKLEAGVSVNSIEEEGSEYRTSPCVLKTSSVFNGKFLPNECKTIIPKDIHRAKLTPQKNTIIISRMNTPDLVGECGYVSEDYGNLFLPDRLWITRFQKEFSVQIKWLAYILSYSNFRKAIKDTATGTSGSMKNIAKDAFLRITIPFPPLPEQRSIATVLSDTDALIESLEKAIVKKRNLKQATMQQLLTGKTRLPGFSGEWEVKRLGDISKCFSGGTPSTSIPIYYNGNIPWINSSDLNKKYITEVDNYISPEGLINSSAKMVDSNTLLIALYGATAGIAAISKIRAAINQAVLAIVPFRDDQKFLFFQLDFLKDWLISTFTQGGQPNLSGEIIKSLVIQIPSLSEQTAIATVLSDMDAEIAALEQRRDKTRLLKQGMMQELLTGRIRLV